MGSDYDGIDALIDSDPIALGERCRKAEAALWAARDMAFRAAFGSEEGATVEWSAVETVNGSRVLCANEAEARDTVRCAGMPDLIHAERRIVGPWKAVRQEASDG